MSCLTSAKEVLLRACPEKIIIAHPNAEPGHLYAVRITDKFGRQRVKNITANSAGVIEIIANDFYPPGTFNAYAGSFLLEIFHGTGFFADYYITFANISDPNEGVYTSDPLIYVTGEGALYVPPVAPPVTSGQDSWIISNW